MREVIHDLQLKSAIDRQNIAKNKRTASQIAQKITEIQQSINKQKKQRETDETYLLKQEKKLNNLRVAKPKESMEEKLDRLEKEN
jgi:hypothetical protein